MTEQEMYAKMGLSQSDTNAKILQMATYLRYHYDTQSSSQSRKRFQDPAMADKQWDYICTIMLNIAQLRQSQQYNTRFYFDMVETLEKDCTDTSATKRNDKTSNYITTDKPYQKT